jgi:hypothetical protein
VNSVRRTGGTAALDRLRQPARRLNALLGSPRRRPDWVTSKPRSSKTPTLAPRGQRHLRGALTVVTAIPTDSFPTGKQHRRSTWRGSHAVTYDVVAARCSLAHLQAAATYAAAGEVGARDAALRQIAGQVRAETGHAGTSRDRAVGSTSTSRIVVRGQRRARCPSAAPHRRCPGETAARIARRQRRCHDVDAHLVVYADRAWSRDED